jgi:hypothetical protein
MLPVVRVDCILYIYVNILTSLYGFFLAMYPCVGFMTLEFRDNPYSSWFTGVWIWVALKYPRVTCGDP